MLIIFKLITYVILAYGTSSLLIYFNGPFNIIDHFRNLMTKIHGQLGELFKCEACTSTWVGFVLSIINIVAVPTISFTPFNIIFQDNNLWWLIIPLDGLFTCGSTWLLFRLEDFLTRNAEEDGK